MESRFWDTFGDEFKIVSTYFSAPFCSLDMGTRLDLPTILEILPNDMLLKSNFTGNHLICKTEINLMHRLNSFGFNDLRIKCFPVLKLVFKIVTAK